MGTQFWWFYDVLALSVAAGMFYAAVAKGFNKIVFQLFGFLLAMAVGIYGSGYLKDFVYDSLFHEKIVVTVRSALEQEDWDVFEIAAASSAVPQEDEAPPDAEALRALYAAIASGTETCPPWFAQAVCNTVQYAVSAQQRPHAEQSLSELYDEAEAMQLLQALLENDPDAAAQMLERDYYRPAYLNLVRMAVFLLIELVMLIIYGVIASVGGNLEEQMHIRRGNRLLAVPAGLLEAACMLVIVTVAVRLIVQMTDGEMLLFNQETIDETRLFRYLYRLFGG